MSLTLAHLERLQQLHEFLLGRKTGPPKSCAERFSISPRTLREDLQIIREWGGKVGYNRKDQTYYYLEEFDLYIHIEVVALSAAKQRKIYGGYSSLISRDHLLNS